MPPDTTPSTPPQPPDTHALLHRILAAVENNSRRGRLELVVAIILSLAALASTWCGYQARLWGGMQSNDQAAADTAERQAAEDTIVGLQMRTFDAMEINAYWTALRQKDIQTSDAIIVRMRPQLRQALEASLAAGVLTHPEVPGPLHRPEYILTQEQEAKSRREDSRALNTRAQSAGKTCGSYVLLTLMFASVLFFGGITGTFTSRRVRTGLSCVALVLFLATLALMIGLPIAKG